MERELLANGRHSIADPTLRGLRELAAACGEPEQFDQLVDLFLNELTSTLPSMHQALARKDADELERLAHSLKGSSGSMGAGSLAALSSALQDIAKNAAFQEADAQLTRIEQEVDTVRAILANVTMNETRSIA
jgi:HPt (histidine-containing phosphotransfer) domain-containing protein